MGAIKVFLKEVVLPIALAFCLASFLKPIYMPDGVCDYFLMWICVGLPFGIRRMCLWLVPSGYGISGSVGIFALNLIIGGLIGGLAFFIGLLLGVIHTIEKSSELHRKRRGFVSSPIWSKKQTLFFCCPKAGVFAGDAAKERSF